MTTPYSEIGRYAGYKIKPPIPPTVMSDMSIMSELSINSSHCVWTKMDDIEEDRRTLSQSDLEVLSRSMHRQ